MIWPSTSERKTVPEADMRILTVSITSTKTSFLRYLMSDRRQPTAPVAWIEILALSSRTACSDLNEAVVMYILRVSISLFCGIPKSMISAVSLAKRKHHKAKVTYHPTARTVG